MNELTLQGVVDASFGPVSQQFGSGLHVLSGHPITLGRLVEIASGVRIPKRGRVSLRTPAGTELPVPEGIASLLPDEELLVARDVEHALTAALALRQLPLLATVVLRDAGLAQLAHRHPSRLDPLERRAVHLALALADTNAGALALFDPLSVSPLISRDFVLQRCLEHAQEKPVFIATPYWGDALILGGIPLVLLRGAVFRATERAGGGATISVRSRQARRVAGLLAVEPGVIGIGFDAERAPFEVCAKSIDPEVLAEAIARIAGDHDLRIESLSITEAPGPELEAPISMMPSVSEQNSAGASP